MTLLIVALHTLQCEIPVYICILLHAPFCKVSEDWLFKKLQGIVNTALVLPRTKNKTVSYILAALRESFTSSGICGKSDRSEEGHKIYLPKESRLDQKAILGPSLQTI